MRGGVLLSWSNFVALGDSLTAGKGDAGPGGHPVGWAQRLADVLSVRTAVRCTLTNMAEDRATVSSVLKEQLPKVAAAEPDLVSVTVGMNDIRARGFDEMAFKSELGQLLEGLAGTKAKVLTCTLPNIAAIMPLPPELTEIARERMRLASDIIREQAESYEAVCLDAWSLPGLCDPELYSADRMHPNGKGHQFIAAAFADKLAPR
jgi:lysophospholipase L1-like esterase